MTRIAPIVLAGLLAGTIAGGAAAAESEVVLDPDAHTERSGIERWQRARHRVSEVRVETQPTDAQLELRYVREQRTRLHERTQAPTLLRLPSVAGGDVVVLRALRPGYRTRELSYPANEIPARIEILLEPLPNALLAATHRRLVGRRSLVLWTQSSADVRVQETARAVHVVLAETRSELAGRPDLSIENVGEDLFVAVALDDGWQAHQELRAHQGRDPVRGLERIVIEWVPRDGGLAATERARAGLARLGADDVDVCARQFERELRQAMPATSLARALAPTGRFLDAIQRATLRRLAELDRIGLVELVDGTRFDPMRPIEADLAMGRASEIRGYLAILSGFVRQVTTPHETDRVLASLIAPDLPAAEVAQVIAEARRVERSCRAPN